MKLLFVYSHKFEYDENKIAYSNGQFPYKVFEERYLRKFDELLIAARGKNISGNVKLNKSSGPNVKHFILPELSKIKGRTKSIKEVKLELESLIVESDALVARMPSEHAYYAIKIARKLKKPYAVEVVGDVFASLWNHGSIFGKILAPINYIKYKKIIKESTHLVYVTKDFLQEKYPPKIGAYTTNISNVDISPVTNEVLRDKIADINGLDIKGDINIGLIGSYASKYKGIDTAIKSIKILNDKGYNCSLRVLGTGNNSWLKELSKKLEIQDKVFFDGSLPGGSEVFKWLDNLDLYVQPSLTEGLPRALIESMSRGLPCVGSSAGGIPELINKKFIHTPKSAEELSGKIITLLNDKQEMLDQATENFNCAKNYTSNILNNKRDLFWEDFIDKEITGK